jgi:hypothetical protein
MKKRSILVFVLISAAVVARPGSTPARNRAFVVFCFGLAILFANIQLVKANIVLDPAIGQSSATVQANLTGANDAGVSHTTDFNSLPTASPDSATQGGDSTHAVYSFDANGFSASISQNRVLSSEYAGDNTQGVIYFRATDNTTSYQISGSYTYSTPDFLAYVILSNEGNGVDLFYDQQTLDNSASESGGTFIAGSSPAASGSLSGLLQAGVDYEFTYGYETIAFPNADFGATATGTVAISFTDTSVPEPAAALIPALSVICLLRRPAAARA